MKSQNGTIENCEIDGSSMSGLFFDVEMNWPEAFIPRDAKYPGTVVKNIGHEGDSHKPIHKNPKAVNIF